MFKIDLSNYFLVIIKDRFQMSDPLIIIAISLVILGGGCALIFLLVICYLIRRIMTDPVIPDFNREMYSDAAYSAANLEEDLDLDLNLDD